MEDTLSKNWWAVTIRGLLAIAFGVVLWARPGFTMKLLVIAFGLYALNDGIFAIVSAVRASRRQQSWWQFAVEGVLGIVLGLAAFTAPAAAAALLLVVVAFWAIVTGGLELVAALRLRRRIKGEGLLALSALLRVLFGVVLLARPGTGVRAFVGVTGLFAFLYGALLLALSFRLRRHQMAAGTTGMAPPGGITPQPA